MNANDNFSDKLSLNREYFKCCAMIICIVVFLSGWLIWTTHANLAHDRLNRYKTDADRACFILREAFDHTTNLLAFISAHIIQTGTQDAQTVSNIIKNNSHNQDLRYTLFPWTIFEFLNSDDIVIANNTTGIVEQYQLSRSWLKLARSLPAKLHFSKPDIGMISGKYIIPSGYGITNQQGEYIGALSAGFVIDKLKNRIARILNSTNSQVIILTKDYNFVAMTSKYAAPNNTDFFKNALINRENHNGVLSEPIIFDMYQYSYIKSADPFPYLILVGENKANMDQELQNLIIPHLIQISILGLIFAILLYFFRMKIVNPMVLLSQQAVLISEGNYFTNMPEVNSREAAHLVRALELVKTAFYKEQDMRHQINHTNELLEKMVAERTADLEKALTAKMEFLSNMSHEIRTPIHGIINFADYLVDNWDDLPNSEQRYCATRIRSSTNRLSSLIENLLDLSQLSANKMYFNFNSGDLKKLVQEVMYESESLYRGKKDIELVLSYQAGEDYTAIFDKIRIEQVIRNLIANAIKFSQNGTITITLEHISISEYGGDCIQITVEDQGIGIPESELENVFEKFTQSSRTKTGAGGTGIGLAICYEIVKAHGGKIWAQSNQHRGAKLIFFIPKHGIGYVQQ